MALADELWQITQTRNLKDNPLDKAVEAIYQIVIKECFLVAEEGGSRLVYKIVPTEEPDSIVLEKLSHKLQEEQFVVEIKYVNYNNSDLIGSFCYLTVSWGPDKI